jgi:hypothetical protein
MDKEEENEKRRKRKRNMRNVTLSLNIGAWKKRIVEKKKKKKKDSPSPGVGKEWFGVFWISIQQQISLSQKKLLMRSITSLLLGAARKKVWVGGRWSEGTAHLCFPSEITIRYAVSAPRLILFSLGEWPYSPLP